MGCSRLGSDPQPITDHLRFYVIGTPSENLTHYVELESPEIWMKPIPADEVAPTLSFIKKKDKWPNAFRGSVKRIQETDYIAIMSRVQF